MNRRTFLLTALGTTAALAVGVSLYRPEMLWEMAADDGDEASQRLLWSLLLPVLLDGALPEVSAPRVAAINRTIDAINHTRSQLPERQQQEINILLKLLDNRLSLLLITGGMTPLLLRSPDQLVILLEQWRQHSHALFNIAYQGLRELVMASYYGVPEHWSALNYVKPQLG